MDITVFFLKLSKTLKLTDDSPFEMDVDAQKKYLYSLPEPKDEIERSFCQYLCQKKLGKPLLYLLYNVGSLICTPFLLLFFVCKSSPKYRTDINDVAVFFSSHDLANILPDRLRAQYSEVILVDNLNYKLKWEDVKFIFFIICRYPMSGVFNIKNILKIASYRYCMEQYHPKAFIVHSEYSFSSSVLTLYCNHCDITHINVMHGEKVFYIRDSFFKFNECYVWDEYYINLFTELRAFKMQFDVAVPQSLMFTDNIVKCIYDYTYYLQDESVAQLYKIYKNLCELKANGAMISIRPHPRYSDIDTIRKIFGNFHIEDVDIVSIEQSVLQTRNAISLTSTVLQQAYFNNTAVIIDDLSAPDKYSKLKSLGYIMLSKKSELLSDVLKKDRFWK